PASSSKTVPAKSWLLSISWTSPAGDLRPKLLTKGRRPQRPQIHSAALWRIQSDLIHFDGCNCIKRICQSYLVCRRRHELGDALRASAANGEVIEARICSSLRSVGGSCLVQAFLPD